MIEVLEIPEFRKRVAPISVDFYHRMIDLGLFDDCAYELIEGALVEKMSKSELHVLVVRLLFNYLGNCSPEGHFVQKEDPITLDISEPEPDLAVIKGDWKKVKKPTTARFIIEVAVTSLAEDRAKANGYARANVPEYWIVLPEAGKTEVYRKPENGKYRETEVFDATETIRSTAIPAFDLNLAGLLD